MNVYQRLMGGCIWAVAAAVLSMTATGAWAQSTSQPADTAAKPDAKVSATDKPAVEAAATRDELKKETATSNIGTVTGNDVYVRSGFHQNYYPVTKLSKGDKVTVLGEEYGWLKIAPPAGTYSLVEKTLIDKVDDQTGAANGEAVVFAGSNLNDRRYAKQTHLAKGDKVQLIGETSDGGFYKIQPPAGATLWIKGDLVDRGGKGESKIETVPPGKLLGESGTSATRPAGGGSVAKSSTTRPSGGSTNLVGRTPETQMDIKAIEALVSAEMTKPFNERSFETVIAKLRPLSEQTADPVAQQYAKVRMQQLADEAELSSAARAIRESKENAIREADRIAAERAKITVAPTVVMDDIVVRGEIQVSEIYNGFGGKPQRWRVVSPEGRRTLAYIEVPKGSPIDPVQYYGKYIGIRASTRQNMPDTTPPVPIFTVKEIVVQDPMAPRNAELAGGNPPVVPAPSSQPSTLDSATSQPAASAAQGPEAKPASGTAK